MFANFIKTALRFLWRNRTYTILNYLCLTFGLTCSIVAALNVTRVLNYDKFHRNYDRLYEVEANVTYFNGDQFPKEPLSASVTDVIGQNVPEIEALTRIKDCSFQVVNGNDSFSENGIYADPNLFQSFTFPLVNGTVSGALSGNNSIVISERLAAKYFTTTDCIGKSLVLKNDSGQETFTISGVMRNVPNQSYMQFDFILPFAKFLSTNPDALDAGASTTFFWALIK